MGLTISSNFSQLLTYKGGSGIEVNSIQGVGSEFSFTIENKIELAPKFNSLSKLFEDENELEEDDCSEGDGEEEEI